MDILQKKDTLVIKNIKDFNLAHTFECGQCFRWEKEQDDSYTGVVDGKIINVSTDNDDIILKNISLDEAQFFAEYLDLQTDYSKIKSKLAKMDDYLKSATKFGYGIRLLKQDFHEIVISFIISARNSIPMIKRSINKLSQEFGEYIGEYNGKKYYTFPTMKVLANADLEKIKEAKVAFRTEYIKKTAQMIEEKNITSDFFDNLSLDETCTQLQEFSGVGPKVADCIALFSLCKYDSFPVDVWVQRVMQEFYLKDEKMSLQKLRNFSIDKFKNLGGYAQQYLFYYARENGIGKKK